MNLRSTAVVVLFLALSAYGQDGARLSISELLAPETRLRAFQSFQLKAEPEKAEQAHWSDIDAFAETHHDLRITEFHPSAGVLHYLLTWTWKRPGNDWSEEKVQASTPALPAAQAPESGILFYQTFSSDGEPLEKEQTLFDAVIADLDGDGEPEVIERKNASPSGFTASQTAKEQRLSKLQVEFLQVRRPWANSTVSFAILYNTHPKERALGNTWSFQVRDIDGDGLPEIELGPVAGRSLITPKEAFRWDRDKRAWSSPTPKKGDHFRVLAEDQPMQAAVKIAAKGGLGYPLAPVPERAKETIPFLGQPYDVRAIPADQLSKAYRITSLRRATNENLVEFMAGRRDAWTYLRDRMQDATSAPRLWQLPPKAAALYYVERNRPPAIAHQHLLSFYTPANEEPPEEGDLTLSDAPSGCFAPFGAFIHHLHCTRDESYLAYTEITHDWFPAPIADDRTRINFRRLSLAYEEAQRLLQTVWWMSRIRSQSFTPSTGSEWMSGGSTSDGFATVQIVSGKRSMTIQDLRSGISGTFLGVGCSSAEYDASAFINLVCQLFRRDVPEKLGAPWKTQGLQPAPDSRIPAANKATAEQLNRLQTTAKDLLRLYREQKVCAEAVLPIAFAIGDLGWRDFREDLESIAQALPPHLEYEKRIEEIDVKIKQWREKLGPEADLKAFQERQRKATPSTFDSIPGLSPLPGEPSPPVRLPDPRFKEMDALYESREQIRLRAPKQDTDIARLRDAIPFVLRCLEVYNDAAQIERWAGEDNQAATFALARLAVLDKNRAARLLQLLEDKTESEDMKRSYAAARRALVSDEAREQQGRNGSQPSSEEQTQALVTLRNPQSPLAERSKALADLVPSGDPLRYNAPEIDDALNDLLTRGASPSEMLPEGTLTAAALRLRGKAWERLAAYAQSQDQNGMPRLITALPALTFIAQIEPIPYRGKLRKILEAELDSTYGSVSTTLWSIWQLDLRELKPRLERIATRGPEDYEGIDAETISTQRHPVKYRYHRARHIAALWNEDDPLTRAKLHIAFAAAEAETFSLDATGSLAHLQQQLAALLPSLRPAERKTLSEFTNWCEANVAAMGNRRVDPEHLRSVLQSIRSSF